MKFALLMYADPAHTRAMSAEQVEEIMRKHGALRDELGDKLIGGAGLVLPEETVVVRVGAAPQQGPLQTETVEQLTAYYEIECATAEQAQSVAERVLDHHVTAVEVRRIHDSA
jgi:hypothetical protein